jgi:hypothetical protein
MLIMLIYNLLLMRRPCLLDMIEKPTQIIDPQKTGRVDMIEKAV